MNSNQISKATSYRLMLIEAENDPTSVSLISNFAKGMLKLAQIVTDIDSVSVQQSKNLTGITEGKNIVMETICDYLVDISGAVHSYANGISDKTLQAKVNYTANQISNMTQPELINLSAVVLEEAGKIPAAALAEEGITADEITDFTAMYHKFKGMTTDKREAVIDQSSYTQKLADLFEEAADLKKNTLDRLATQFQRKAPEFYQKYKAASTVIHKRAAKAATEETAKA